MAGSLKMHSTYSVFVGRIPPDTKKYELRDLFEGCGDIVDVVIIDNSNTSQHYGFVRFTNKESALCAVSELNHWVFNGNNIIVALEKSTQVKIEQEKEGLQIRAGYGSRKNELKSKGKSSGTDYITDTMNWARLQESVTAVNLKHADSKHLSMTKLAEDINQVKDNKCTRLWGSVDDATTSFSQISSKIMQRCQAKGELELGKKNCAEFISALRTIMKEIEGVLDQKHDNNGDEVDNKELEEINQLALEGKLVREVNEELDKDIELMGKEEDYEGRHTNNKKRLSDVSVQTVSIDDDNNVLENISDREITWSKHNHCIVDGCDGLNQAYIDPAIIDFHLSQMQEIENKEKKREPEVNRYKSTEEAKIVEELNSKMNLRSVFSVDKNFERSNSRDSSLSDDVNVDDSGVESDCFGGVKSLRSLGILDSMLGVNDDSSITSRRHLHGSSSEPSLRQSDHYQNPLKNRGSGYHHNIGGSGILQNSGQTSIPALGRGILTNFKSLKHPVARGHHS